MFCTSANARIRTISYCCNAAYDLVIFPSTGTEHRNRMPKHGAAQRTLRPSADFYRAVRPHLRSMMPARNWMDGHFHDLLTHKRLHIAYSGSRIGL